MMGRFPERSKGISATGFDHQVYVGTEQLAEIPSQVGANRFVPAVDGTIRSRARFGASCIS